MLSAFEILKHDFQALKAQCVFHECRSGCVSYLHNKEACLSTWRRGSLFSGILCTTHQTTHTVEDTEVCTRSQSCCHQNKFWNKTATFSSITIRQQLKQTADSRDTLWGMFVTGKSILKLEIMCFFTLAIILTHGNFSQGVTFCDCLESYNILSHFNQGLT